MKKLLVLLTFVVLLFAFAIPTAAETPSTEGILVYDGLGARIREDFPGIRSIYTADHAKIDALVAEGYKVEYGAVMGVSSLDGSTERYSSRDMTVTYTKGKGYTAQNANAAAVCVYSSDANVTYDTEKYVKTVGDSYTFAYTTTFKAENESKQAYLFGFAYVGFVSVTAPGEETPTITYVYAEGDTFGKENAAYGKTTSLYEISDYFCNEYDKDASVKERCRASQSVRRVLRLCSNDYFEIDHGESGFVSSSSSTKYTTTLENARAGFYEVKLARTTAAVNPDFYVQTGNNGQYDFYDCFLGGGLPSSDGRYAATQKANDGKTLETTLYVYLDEGDNLFTYYMSTSTTVYKVTLTLVEEIRSEFDGSVTESLSPKKAWSNAFATPQTQTVAVTVKESGYYNMYAVYSAGINQNGANIDVTVTSPSGIVSNTETYNIKNTRTALYSGTSAWYMKGTGTSYCAGNLFATYLEAGTSTLTFSFATTAADGSTNASNNRFGFSVLVPIRETHTVTFNDYNGKAISTQTVVDGGSATLPKLPTRAGGYVCTGFDGVWENVTEDSVCTAVYKGTNTYYENVIATLTEGTPLSISSTAQTVIEPKAMTPGIYQVRMARTCTAVSGQATLTVDGRTYSDGFVGSGLKDATTGNKNREAYAKKANDGEYEAHVMYIYLDGGDSAVTLSATAAIEMYKISLTLVSEATDGTVVYTPRQSGGSSYTVTPTVSKAGEYKVHAIYSYKANTDFGLTVNGQAYDGISKTFVDPGVVSAPDYYDFPISNMSSSGYAFRYDEIGTVALTEGQNTLTLSYTSGVVNLNSLILIPVETPEECTVTFVDADGTVLKTETVAYGAAATAPTVDCDYASVSWDKDFSAVKTDMTVTAIYSDYTKYTETYDALSFTPNAEQTIMTTPDMEPGIYQVRVARKSSAIAGQATVTVNGRVFHDAFLGLGVVGQSYANGRGEHAKKANDGESLLHFMYVYLDEGENTIKMKTLNMNTGNDFVLYAMSLERVESGKDAEVFMKRSAGTAHTVTANAAEAGAYKVYAIYSYGANTTIGVTANGTEYGNIVKTYVGTGNPSAPDYYDFPISNMSSGGYAFQYDEIATVQLNSGENSLTLTATASINLTAIILVPVEKDGTHTVTFVDVDGTVLKTETVKDGGAATAPAVDCDYATVSWDKDFSNVTESITVTAVYSDFTEYTVTAESGNITGTVESGFVSGKNPTVTIPVDMEKGLYNVYLIGTDNGTSGYSTANINGTIYRTKASLPDTYTGEETFFMNVLLENGENSITFSLSDSMDIYAVRFVETSDLSGDKDIAVTYGGCTSDVSFNNCGYLIRNSGGYIDFTVDVVANGTYAVRMSGNTAPGDLSFYEVSGDSETLVGKVTMTVKNDGGSSSSSGEVTCAGEISLSKGTHTIRVKTTATNTLFTALGFDFISGEDMKILVIGNSFSLDATHYLSAIAAANAEKTGYGVTVGVLYRGSSYVKKHWEVIESKDTTYFAYYENGTQKKGQIGVDEALSMYDWDIVVLQQWTDYSDKMEHYDDGHTYAFQPYLNKIAAYVAEACPTAEIMLHETWAYEKGFTSCSTAENQLTMANNSIAMNARVASDIGAYLYENGLKATSEPIRVLHSGYAMQYLRDYTDANGNKIFDTTFNKATLTGDANAYTYGSEIYNGSTVSLHRDGFHASLIARYYLAAVWYNTIFGEGVSGSTYYPEAFTVSAMGYEASGSTKSVNITFAAPPTSIVTLIRTLADTVLDDMTVTVTFVDADGTVLKTETVAFGGAATAPTVAGNVTWDKSFDYVTSNITVKAVYSDCTEFTAKANTSALTGEAEAATDANGAYVEGKVFTVKVNQDMKAGLYNLFVVGTASYSGYPTASVNGVSYRSKIALPSDYTANGTFMFTVLLTDGVSNTVTVTLPASAKVYAVNLVQVEDTSDAEDMAFTYNDMKANTSLSNNSGYALSGSNYVDIPISLQKGGIYKAAFSGNTASGISFTFYTVDAEGNQTLIATNAATTVNNAMSSQSSGYVTVGNTVPLPAGEYTLRICTTGSNGYVTAAALSYVEELVFYNVYYYFDRNGDGDYTDDELVMTRKQMKNTEIPMPTASEMGYTPSETYATMCSTATEKVLTGDAIVYSREYVLPVFEEQVKTNAERDASEFRVLVVSDTHYNWPFDEYNSWGITGAGKIGGGFTPQAKAQLIVDSLIAEYNTKESFDLVILNGDICFNDPAFNRDQTFNTVEEFNRLYLSQLSDAGIPYYAVYGGHDYMNDEVWKNVFGYEKDYILTIGDAAFIITSNFVCNPEDYQSMKDTEAHFAALANQYLADHDEIRHAYIVTHHYPYSNNKNLVSLVQNEKVEAIYCAHTHYDTADLTYYGKPILYCGHWSHGEGFNQKHWGHGLTNYIPYGSNFVSVMAGVGNEGYYNLKSVVVGSELLKDANGNTVTVKRDQNGYYLDFTVDGKTYYLFANYKVNGVKKCVFKSMTEDAFYVVNDNATLTKLTSFAFEYTNNSPYFLLENIVTTDEYLTYEGEKLYADIVDGVARDLLLTESGNYTFVPYGKIKTRIDLSLRYAGKGEQAFNGGATLYDPIWTTYTYPVGEEAIVYHLEGTTHYFTPHETTGELILLYDYYIGDVDTDGFYTFTDVRLATDGNSTVKTPAGETLTAGVTIMDRNVSYDYFVDANGNRVNALTDASGKYVTVTAPSAETVYRYVVYGVTKNSDGSFRFIYKNNSTNDFYLVMDDGSMKKIESFSFVTMSYFDRPSEDGVIDYSVIGTPFCYRVAERVNGEYADIIESYMIYPEIDYLPFFAQGASYGAFSQTYLRARPSDMGGNSDRTYLLLGQYVHEVVDLPTISFADESNAASVKTTGRTVMTESGIAADFTGAGVEFNAVLTENSAIFLNITTAASIGGAGMTTASTGECFISVYVDGVKSVYYLAPGENSVFIGEFSAGTYNVRVVKETEAQYALMTVNGVRMNGVLGDRPADEEILIEFVGDSITSGFGNVTSLGSGSSNQAIYRESATQSYGYLTAEMLGVDYSIVSRAGMGLTSGCSSQYTAMYPYTDFVRGNEKYTPARTADIVVINLGTNDLGKSTEANVPSEAKAILAAVRAMHGDSVTVIWAYDMMNDGCIDAIMTALDGEGVHFVKLTRSTAGLYGHPNAQGHASSAEILAAYIEELLAE